MRLLVVDDDEDFRDELRDLLEEEGHRAAAVSSVAKALERLEAAEFDAVFTDLRMPRRGGLDLVREVRARWPATAVVVVTGFATVQTAVEAMRTGAFDYLAKPFRGDHLRDLLRQLEQVRRPGPELPASTDAGSLAVRWRASGGRPILLVGPDPPPDASVRFLPSDGSDLSRLAAGVEAFLTEHPDGGVVVAHGERLLAQHRLADVRAVVARLRDRMTGGGPFAIGVDAAAVDGRRRAALQGALVSPELQGAIEALAHPIRRAVLDRLTDAPASFSEVMVATGLADSPKLSFHLRRLEEEGVIRHASDSYGLTEKGQALVRSLHQIESIGGLAPGRGLFDATGGAAARDQADPGPAPDPDPA